MWVIFCIVMLLMWVCGCSCFMCVIILLKVLCVVVLFWMFSVMFCMLFLWVMLGELIFSVIGKLS